MRQYRVEAIIIKRKNIGEADRIVTVFSREHGKISLLAKGIRRIPSRRAPHLELFNHVQLSIFHSKKWDYIIEATTIQPFSDLKEDFHRVSIAYLIAELMEVLCPEHQEQPEAYELFLSALTRLNLDKEYTPDFAPGVGRALLEQLGFIGVRESKVSFDSYHFVESLIERKLRSRALLSTLTRGFN